jgi:hypothetical protein
MNGSGAFAASRQKQCADKHLGTKFRQRGNSLCLAFQALPLLSLFTHDTKQKKVDLILDALLWGGAAMPLKHDCRREVADWLAQLNPAALQDSGFPLNISVK